MARGYRNYRGRTSVGKIVLAVLLVLVILAALGALAMQRYIAYDESGTPFFRLPQRQTADPAPAYTPPSQTTEDPDSLEVIVQEPEKPAVLQIYSLTAAPLTPADWESARAAMGDTFGGVAVTLRDTQGSVFFPSQVAAKKAVQTVSGTTWLDPGRPAAREYLCGLAREAAELGFDEILLTDTGYPTQGDLNKLNYGSGSIEENLNLLWQDLLQTLEPYGVKLSIELPEAVISDGQEAASGLTLAGAVSYADRIYAVAAPGQAEILSNLVLQTEAAAEKRVQDFLPELTAPDPDWEGPFLLLPNT